MKPATDPTGEVAARRRSRGPLVLAVDPDSLVKGPRAETGRLAKNLHHRPHTSIVYASGTRSVTSASVCVEVFHLPAPDVVVADNGASVHPARRHSALEVLDETIAKRWPGAESVRARVERLGDMLDEDRRDDARQIRYFPRRGVAGEEVRAALEDALHGLDVDVRVRDREEVDVLPGGTHLPTTLHHTLLAINADPAWVVIAGSCLEPELLQRGGYWGIVTGETPRSVRAALENHPRAYVTNAGGARGVREGLRALRFVH